MHQTVLLKEAIDGLSLEEGDIVIDCTVGAGGHSEEICRQFGKKVRIVALDLDSDALDRSENRLSGMDCDITFHLANFRDFEKALKETDISKVDGFLLDLGFSSYQLEDSGRGISFQKEEPLTMTLKKEVSESDITASMIVNEWSEESIANILYGYGNERFSRRIAREIVLSREKGPINTTTDLVNIINRAVPFFYKNSRINPATKTFQALRIAVNDELGSLNEFLEKSIEYLNPGGRISIISFHSLEDRLVKQFFKKLKQEQKALVLTKKPIIPSEEELKSNPRSRSAKLRIIQKI